MPYIATLAELTILGLGALKAALASAHFARSDKQLTVHAVSPHQNTFVFFRLHFGLLPRSSTCRYHERHRV